MAQAMQIIDDTRKEGMNMFTGGKGGPSGVTKKAPPQPQLSKEKVLTEEQKKALIAKLEAGEIGKKELGKLTPAERQFVISLVKSAGKEIEAGQQASTKKFYKDAIASAGKYHGPTEGKPKAPPAPQPKGAAPLFAEKSEIKPSDLGLKAWDPIEGALEEPGPETKAGSKEPQAMGKKLTVKNILKMDPADIKKLSPDEIPKGIKNIPGKKVDKLPPDQLKAYRAAMELIGETPKIITPGKATIIE